VCKPGVHRGLPYPFAEVTRVSTTPKTIKVDDFWLKLSEQDQTKNLNEVMPHGQGLDPAFDGALLTADKAIMHMRLEVKYHVPEDDADRFVQNVKDAEALVRSVVKQAAVAETARTTADVVLHDSKTLALSIQRRARALLRSDDPTRDTGIEIDSVIAPKSHYPLQTTAEFLAVDIASNRATLAINDAQGVRQQKLNGAAGPAWQAINAEIEKLDQAKEDKERIDIIKKIGELLTKEAKGEAGGRITRAQGDRENVVNDTLAEVSAFEALLPEYQRNPELVRMRLSQFMREDIFDNVGVSKWILPPNDKQVVLWMAVDPRELAERERRRMEDMKKKQ
jgi:modulator of FtsH protease HflK